MSGYVLIHRDIIGNPQFRGKDDEYAAIWLVLHAAWEAATIRVNREAVALQRGQCAYAISFLAQAWECSKATAHARVRHLESCGFIRTQAERGYTLITICKYSEYQQQPNDARTQGQTPPERKPNAARTNKNKGNELNTGGVSPLTPVDAETPPDAAGSLRGSSTADMDRAFDAWWQHYPRRVAKPAARRAYERATKEASHAELLAGVMRYAAECTGKEDRYIAHPTTWLNQGRWTDEATPHAEQQPSRIVADIDARRRAGLAGAVARRLDAGRSAAGDG